MLKFQSPSTAQFPSSDSLLAPSLDGTLTDSYLSRCTLPDRTCVLLNLYIPRVVSIQDVRGGKLIYDKNNQFP
jgi:hypothetical protein